LKKTSLENAFNSYFHDKQLFKEFLEIDVNFEYEDIFYSKNTFSPSKQLKQFQQFLNLFIFDFMTVNTNVVFSYRKGVGSIDAVIPHKNSKYVYTTDIKSFFTHINIDNVKKLIIDSSDNYLILKDDIVKYIDRILSLVTYKNILPIGAPTSPKISNAYLFNFDNDIESYCKLNNIIFTRYSDDFIFSATNKECFIELETMVIKLLNTSQYRDFSINDKKTKVQKRDYNINILGLVITSQGHITVDKKSKDNLEVLFHFYLSDKSKFKEIFEKYYDSSIEKVSGKISHIQSIDKVYITKLKKKYGSYVVNSFIHRDITNE